MKKITKKSEERQGVQQLVLDIPEIVGRELHELVVGAGMSVLAKMLEAERENCAARATSTRRRAQRRAVATRGPSSLWEAGVPLSSARASSAPTVARSS
jgi:hypothetical protein